MSTKIYTSNGKILINGSNNKWLRAPDQFNPLGLGDNTMRIKITHGTSFTSSYYTITNVSTDATGDVYDIGGPDDMSVFNYITATSISKTNVLEVLGLNYTKTYFEVGSSMYQMFSSCTNLTYVGPIKLTSEVNDTYGMFSGCSNLTNIPLINVDNLTSVDRMFNNCYNVASGQVDLFGKLNALGAQITSHSNTFTNCGRDSVTGAAELAQIPSSWGGTAA